MTKGTMLVFTTHVRARKDMFLDLFRFRDFTPIRIEGVRFTRPKERELARIRSGHVARGHPAIYACPLVTESFSSGDNRIEFRKCKAQLSILAPRLNLSNHPPGGVHFFPVGWYP